MQHKVLSLFRRAFIVVFDPAVIAALLLVCGCGMAVAGVYILFGLGVALIVGASPFLYFGSVLLRGALHGI